MTTNLVYVFLDSDFNSISSRPACEHSFEKIPQYYADTFKFNSKKFNNSFIITSNKNITEYSKIFPESAKFISVEDEIMCTEEFKHVHSLIEEFWPKRYIEDAFWYVTFMRLIVLAIFIKNANVKNIIHSEADNLIFETDFTKVFNILASGEYGYSNEAAYAAAPCMILFSDHIAGDNMLKNLTSLLKKGENVIKHHVGHFYNWIADMAFLDLIYRARKNYKMLPCLPFGPYSENFSALNTVFDPISYGQFLGGTNNNYEVGYAEARHFVGNEIRNGTMEVIFDGRPFIINNNQRIPLFNLHLHNKRSIPRFLS